MTSSVGVGRLGPVAVLGALHCPVAHLAFDDVRVGAQTAGEWLGEDLGDRLLMRVADRVGGKSRLGAGGSAGSAEASDER
jgi:hypothetical protein